MPAIPIEDMLGPATIVAGIVWALVEGLKKIRIGAWGLEGGAAAATALLLGPTLALGWTWSASPELTRGLVAIAGLSGLIGSLAAMGVYKLTNWSPPVESPAAPQKP